MNSCLFKDCQIERRLLLAQLQETILYMQDNNNLKWSFLLKLQLQGSFHYFLAKDLGTDKKEGGGERGGGKKL